jgi:hypothetical protein
MLIDQICEITINKCHFCLSCRVLIYKWTRAQVSSTISETPCITIHCVTSVMSTSITVFVHFTNQIDKTTMGNYF